METTTEKDSYYGNLEQMPLIEILENINKEDRTVPLAVAKAISQIEALAAITAAKMKAGSMYDQEPGCKNEMRISAAGSLPNSNLILAYWLQMWA